MAHSLICSLVPVIFVLRLFTGAHVRIKKTGTRKHVQARFCHCSFSLREVTRVTSPSFVFWCALEDLYPFFPREKPVHALLVMFHADDFMLATQVAEVDRNCSYNVFPPATKGLVVGCTLSAHVTDPFRSCLGRNKRGSARFHRDTNTSTSTDTHGHRAHRRTPRKVDAECVGSYSTLDADGSTLDQDNVH